MPITRMLLICLLILTIPIQGMTAVGQLEQPCPMDQAMAAMDKGDEPAGHVALPRGDCCQDEAAVSGQLCKPGQECHISQLSVSGRPIIVGFLDGAPTAVPPMIMSYTPLALNTIWRPPLTLLH